MDTLFLKTAIAAALSGHFKTAHIAVAKMSRQERIQKARKRKAKEEKLSKPWSEMSLREKAKFKSKYEYDQKRRKYVLKKDPGNTQDIFKALKKQSLDMKKRAGRMGKRAARIKRTYTPITVSAIDNHMGLYVDITESDSPSSILVEVILRGRGLPLPKEAMELLNRYYSRPSKIQAFILGGEPLILITEDTSGLYSFEGTAKIIKFIKKQFIKFSEGIEPTLEELKFDSKHTSEMTPFFDILKNS